MAPQPPWNDRTQLPNWVHLDSRRLEKQIHGFGMLHVSTHGTGVIWKVSMLVFVFFCFLLSISSLLPPFFNGEQSWGIYATTFFFSIISSCPPQTSSKPKVQLWKKNVFFLMLLPVSNKFHSVPRVFHIQTSTWKVKKSSKNPSLPPPPSAT